MIYLELFLLKFNQISLSNLSEILIVDSKKRKAKKSSTSIKKTPQNLDVTVLKNTKNVVFVKHYHLFPRRSHISNQGSVFSFGTETSLKKNKVQVKSLTVKLERPKRKKRSPYLQLSTTMNDTKTNITSTIVATKIDNSWNLNEPVYTVPTVTDSTSDPYYFFKNFGEEHWRRIGTNESISARSQMDHQKTTTKLWRYRHVFFDNL